MLYSLSNSPKPKKPARDPESESSAEEDESEHVLNRIPSKNNGGGSFHSRLVAAGSTGLWVFWCLCTFALLSSIGLASVALYSKSIKMEMIFSNRIRTPWFANLSDCHSFGLVKCKNLQLRSTDGKVIYTYNYVPYENKV